MSLSSFKKPVAAIHPAVHSSANLYPDPRKTKPVNIGGGWWTHYLSGTFRSDVLGHVLRLSQRVWHDSFNWLLLGIDELVTKGH